MGVRGLACMIVLILAAVFVAVAAFGVNRRFFRDIYIIVRGKRYSGVCVGKFGFKNGDHMVTWSDSDNEGRMEVFPVATIRKPPFSIPVYCVDNDPKKSNLGIRSILYYLPVLILTDLTLGALIFGAIPEWIGLLF